MNYTEMKVYSHYMQQNAEEVAMTDCAWNNPDIEADGFITPLEQLSGSKAKPMAECVFPKCEECDKYHGHYCTVPIVMSKQMWLLLGATVENLKTEIAEVREMVTDLTLSPFRAVVQGNYFAEDVSDDELLPVFEWDDEYGHQRSPLTDDLVMSYKEYEKQGVLHNLTFVGIVKRSDIP